MPRHGFVMLRHGLKVNNWTDLACRGTKRSCRGMLLSDFCVRQGHAAACQNHAQACSSAFSIFSIFGPFSSLLWSFCSNITYKIKITCKSSQNGDKQDKNTKYKRIKYMYNSPLSATVHYRAPKESSTPVQAIQKLLFLNLYVIF